MLCKTFFQCAIPAMGEHVSTTTITLVCQDIPTLEVDVDFRKCAAYRLNFS